MLWEIKPNKKQLMIFLLPLPLLLYFTFLIHQEMRFVMAAIPFISIIAMSLLSKIIKKKITFYIFIILLLIQPVFNLYHYEEEKQEFSPLETLDVEILFTTHPIAAVKSDAALNLIYYPLFNDDKANEIISDLLVGDSKKAVYLDSCDLDALCKPDDESCENAKDEMIKVIRENFELKHYINGTCKKEIYV